MLDKNGREYAKLSQLEPGDEIELDTGFTCHKAGMTYVRRDHNGLYFLCDEGHHYLNGQADNGEDLVGLYKL